MGLVLGAVVLGIGGGVLALRRSPPAPLNVRPDVLTTLGATAEDYRRFSGLSHDVYYDGRKLDRDDVAALIKEFGTRNDRFQARFALILAGAEGTDGQDVALQWLQQQAASGHSPLARLAAIETIYGMDSGKARSLAVALVPEMNIPNGKIKLQQILDGTLDRDRYRGGTRAPEKF